MPSLSHLASSFFSSSSRRKGTAKQLRLAVIHDPDQDENGPANVDLVLVHGFAGDFRDTWTCSSPEGKRVFWPTELLLPKFPQTRILSFGYDTGEMATSTIRDNARNMLNSLDGKRDGKSKSRPIVFVCHCLGGLITRQAMRFAKNNAMYESISSATKSIMFFGTPHGGGDKTAWKEIAKGYEGFGSKSMIEVLTNNTGDLLEIDEDFLRLTTKYHIVNFFEGQQLPATGKVVVDKTSATRVDGLKNLTVNKNHVEMCQFDSVEDDTFEQICAVIEKSTAEAEGPQVALVQRPRAPPPPRMLETSQPVPSQRMLEELDDDGLPTRPWKSLMPGTEFFFYGVVRRGPSPR